MTKLDPVPRKANDKAMATTSRDIAPGHEWHGPYHEREYGFPLTDEGWECQ